MDRIGLYCTVLYSSTVFSSDVLYCILCVGFDFAVLYCIVLYRTELAWIALDSKAHLCIVE